MQGHSNDQPVPLLWAGPMHGGGDGRKNGIPATTTTTTTKTTLASSDSSGSRHGRYRMVTLGGGGRDETIEACRDRSPTPLTGPGPGARRARIHWRYPMLAVALFVAGALFAVGHDVYYSRLDGTLADTDTDTDADPDSVGALVQGGSAQTWAIRVGTGLAFLNKTGLTAVVGLVGAQQVWLTLRHKAMTIHGIDSMFDVLVNPLALLDRDLVAHAKLLVALAVVSWLLPLASVVTPATLSVQAQPLATVAQMEVRGLNFSDVQQWVATEGLGFISGANMDIATLFSNVYSSGSFVAMAAPFPNASYEQRLYGPSYKCISLAEALAANISATWTIDNPPGSANTTYATFADAFYGELDVPRVHDPLNYTQRIYTAAAPTYMFNTILISAGGTNPRWDGGPATVLNRTAVRGVVHETLDGPPGSNMVCQLYNTSFDVTLQFANGVQTIVPRAVAFLEPQAWSDVAGTRSAMDPCFDVAPPDAPSSSGRCSQATPAYYVTHLLFSYLLTARLSPGASGGVVLPDNQPTIPLLQSPLVHCPDFYNSSQFNDSSLVSSAYRFQAARCRNGTLAAAIEDLSRNFTLSLLAFDGWARAAQPGGAAVTVTTSRLFFAYARRTLWAAYAAALAATLLVLLVGARALWHNGVVSSTSFSATLLATRNPELDALVRLSSGPDAVFVRSVGAQPLDPDIGRLRLRFGYVPTEDGVAQAGFGLDRSR